MGQRTEISGFRLAKVLLFPRETILPLYIQGTITLYLFQIMKQRAEAFRSVRAQCRGNLRMTLSKRARAIHESPLRKL